MRLDLFLVENGYFKSRNKACFAINDSRVLVNGNVERASYQVKQSDSVEVLSFEKYVSVGGYKLEKAINDFKIDVKNKVFLDVGASTGGFTDCLLKCGARAGFCLDVGSSQLDESLLNNKNITVIDNFNARNLNEKTLPQTVDFAVVDCSFISLKLIINQVFQAVKDGGFVIALIKPQFECGKSNLNKSGIVKDKRLLKSVCLDIYDFCKNLGISVINFTNSPVILGKNIEFLIMLSRNSISIEMKFIEDLINNL